MASGDDAKLVDVTSSRDGVLEGVMVSGQDSSSAVMMEKRPQFGNRVLADPQDVFKHNAWDNVVWDTEQREYAEKRTEEQLADALDPDQQEHYEKEADAYWDKFYQTHQDGFFKDRHWLFTEFPELEKRQGEKVSAPEVSRTDFPGAQATYRILEVGCGVGNTVFPVLQTNNDPGLMLYCCDFSRTAVDIVKKHADYSSERCHAFVYDVTDDTGEVPFPHNSLDVIVLIFVLSAISPEKMLCVLNRLCGFLKPGGMILLRDYGRYDMAQLRFKKGHCLSENFYVRGDGTRVYFFTQDELGNMLNKAGLEKVQNIIDSRLQVNRGRQLKMYRVWIQCKYRKPTEKTLETESESTHESIADSQGISHAEIQSRSETESQTDSDVR